MCVSSVYESFLSVSDFCMKWGKTFAHTNVRKYCQKDDETGQMYNDSSGLTSVHYLELKGSQLQEDKSP